MHIVIGVLTALAGLIWAIAMLSRSGVNIHSLLASLNPYNWYRRAMWRKKTGAKPIYSISRPMDAAALLLLGVAQCEGAVSAEQKQAILNIFSDEFHLDANEAADLLRASAFLLRDEIYLVDNLSKILAKSADAFSAEQSESVVALMEQVARIESAVNTEQDKLIAATRRHFAKRGARQGKWG